MLWRGVLLLRLAALVVGGAEDGVAGVGVVVVVVGVVVVIVGDGVDGNYFIMIPFFGCSLSSSREVFFTHNTTAGVIKKKTICM